MITHLQLKNFMGFSDLNVEFSPKVNVIIGENGTGKSHLLKAAYGLCSGGAIFKNRPEVNQEELVALLTEKMQRLFMPLDDKLGKMHRHSSTEKAYLEAKFDQGQKVVATFNNNSKLLAVQGTNYNQYKAEPVFIPTKEVLSFMKGFNSLYDKYELSFDQTYRDICLMLDLPEIRSETLHEKSKWAMSEIQQKCGGRFVFYGGGKVTFKTEHAEYSANSIAEGFRKVGMLSRLLETGSIQPGISGPLFWDEPESNINPKLMKLLVQILLELSRNGQQIILATHDYVLLKWFDLLVNKGKGDHIRFHAQYREVGSPVIKIESADKYQQLNSNTIADTFSDLYDKEIDRSLGGKQA